MYLMPSDVFISGTDSRTEIGVMELVSYIMRGRDPNLLEDMVCVQGKHDKLENQDEKMKM